jgi:hypothetical protein
MSSRVRSRGSMGIMGVERQLGGAHELRPDVLMVAAIPRPRRLPGSGFTNGVSDDRGRLPFLCTVASRP